MKGYLEVGILCILTSVVVIQAADITSSTLLEKADEAEGYESMYAELNQTITTSGGDKRTLTIRMWGVKNGEKQLSLYQAPSDIKGQKILMTESGDSIWMFNAETRRTRKLGSHMKRKKVMGSDFTYEDQAGGKLTEKYTAKITGSEEINGTDCYTAELTPTSDGPSYEKVIAWIGKEDFLSRRLDYYREGESSPHKRMLLSDFFMTDGKKTARKLIMKSLEDSSETVNEITKISFGKDIPDGVFDPRKLDQ